MATPYPPRVALLLLRLVLRGEAREIVTGDLLEEFEEKAGSGVGGRALHAWFWKQSLASLWAATRAALRRRRHTSARQDRAPRLTPSPGGGLLHDVRFALRAMRRRPGFAAAAVITIAVGVGATTSVFSYANWMLLRPLPGVTADAKRLATVELWIADNRGTAILSYPNVLDLDAGSPAVELVAAVIDEMQISGSGIEPFFVEGGLITRSYFDVLGVRAHRGRLLTTDELRPESNAPVAVISHRLWTHAFRADDSAVGRTLTVNGVQLTLVGVATEGFVGHERTRIVDMWVPAGLYPAFRHRGDGLVSERGTRVFSQLIALLAPGAAPDRAETELRDVFASLVAAYPDENSRYEDYQPRVSVGVGTAPRIRAGQWEMVGLMSTVAVLVLLVACANNANLFFGRLAARRGETAVRKALGASRARLLRQHLVEMLALALLGGALAWGVAAGLNRVFTGDPSLGGPIPVDQRVLLFALATAVTLPMLFALLPAWLAGRVELARSLPGAGSFSVGRKAPVRSTLTVLQLSLSLALLVGSLLMIRSLASLAAVEAGFEPKGLVVAALDPGPQGYSREEAIAFYLELLARVREQPAVHSATVAYNGPFETNLHIRVRPGGAPDGPEWPSVAIENAGPDYFSITGIPLLRGRDFRSEEMVVGGAERNRVGVLSESLARSLFGSVDVVGRTVSFHDRKITVVGVAGDVRSNLREGWEPMLYQPLPADVTLSSTSLRLIVRSSRPAEQVAAEVRSALAGVDPNVPLYGATAHQQLMAQKLAEERMLARLLTALALLANTLAAVGLYAVVRWSVVERTREIGARIALGATPLGVVGLVTRQAVVLALIGIVIGYGASLGIAELLRGALFGVEPFDPASWAAASGMLLVVALAAALQPALTAAHVHPSAALKQD